MQFKDVIGQSAIKQRLIASVRDNHVSHAQLFLGPAGSGKLPLALAYAQYILCPNRTETDSCGVCPTCQKMQKLIHPDLHFVVPTAATKKIKSNPESDLFMEEWREYVIQNQGYVDTSSWYTFLDVENKQGYMSVRDAASLLRKLSMKSYEGEYKIAIIWMAEKMRTDTANKLLKLLEEPPENRQLCNNKRRGCYSQIRLRIPFWHHKFALRIAKRAVTFFCRIPDHAGWHPR